MARKRKHDSKVTEATEPPKKQQQQQQEEDDPQNQHQQNQDQPVEEADEYEQVVEEEEEVEEEVEEEEEEDDEDEDGDDDNDEEHQDTEHEHNNNHNHNQISSSDAVDKSAHQNDDEDDDPIDRLLEPFGKEQLINLLREAADNHRDVADRIRRIADEDPVHRKIFVHGLGWDTNAETLINAFKAYGEIEDCKAVSDKVSGKSKGYGFILFKSRSGARKALKEPQKKIGNRMTACQLASIGPVPAAASAAATPVQQQQQQQQQVSEYTQRKIYVSNVGSDLDPQELTNFFAKYGEIEEGPLGLDKHTGKPKGFCLFVYKSFDSAKRALEEPHKNFEGHILHCQKAIDGPKPGKSQHHQHQHQHHHHNMQKSNFQRNGNPGGYGGTAHLMAPSAGPGIGFNQGAAAAAAAPALNPALGQALTALLATQGAGLGLTNLLGSLGSATAVNQSGVPGAAPAMQGAYTNQPNISPGMIGSYGNQGVMQGGYSNQQVGQGSSGRGQHGVGQYAPYMGH